MLEDKPKLKVLDLFSGILVGGFSLGLERTGGFETVAFCEIEEFPRKVLRKHWPEVPIYEDVRKLRGEDVGPVDVICGGYPCQPFSTAGQRRGKEDDRHLWPEFSRLVDELRPTWVIGENVAGHISMGLDDVLSDLEGQGYACRSFVIPACAVDAPHRRDRVWTVADATQLQRNGGTEHSEQGERQKPQSGVGSGAQYVAHANGARLQGRQKLRDTSVVGAGRNQQSKRRNDDQIPAWSAEPRVGGMVDGLPAGVDGPCRWPDEPDIPRVAKGVKDRINRLKALGNAVVPQVVEMFGLAILEAQNEN